MRAYLNNKNRVKLYPAVSLGIASAVAKLEGSIIKWMVGTIISAVAAAFAVAKFVS